MARALMVQGTGSDVGKSVIVCGLCRLLHRRGVRVAPFKSQNMALNSYVTADGLEMGRAQVAQAEACRLAPRVEMNPILLKPAGETGSQVVVMGKPITHMPAQEYYSQKAKLLEVVKRAYDRLEADFDVILIEGAGSPAEINLRESDIVNMRMAELADAPVLLVVDIDRGGAFAWVVGTLELLLPAERERVKGVIVNKFRGDVDLLRPGLHMLEDRTGVPVLGVVPYFRDICIDAEDSVCIERPSARHADADAVDVAVVRLPRISNFTDFDALAHERSVRLRYAAAASDLGAPDLTILPGTKNTAADLLWLRQTGFAQAIADLAKSGRRIVGICGGFQMLGIEMEDPARVESDAGRLDGLGLLDVRTRFVGSKTTHQAAALVHPESTDAAKALFRADELRGYEIHMGETRLEPGARPLLRIVRRSGRAVDEPDGAVSPDGRVWGTYLHGIFDNDAFRLRLINALRADNGQSPMPWDTVRRAAEEKERGYDRLADLLEQSLDMPRVYELAGLTR